MQDVVVGIIAVVVGALFCFRGYLAMRVIIPLWGAFAGFLLGAGLVASITDEGFLRTLLAWLAGVGVGLLFGLVAYLYYEISVLFAMGAIGFSLGASAMVALNVTWSWVIILVGLAAGTLLAFLAIVGDLPTVLLVVLSTLAGASTIVTGIMLLAGTLDTADFTSETVTTALDDDWWWYVIYLGLVIVGLVAQIRSIESIRGTMRDAWTGQGGRTLRDEVS